MALCRPPKLKELQFPRQARCGLRHGAAVFDQFLGHRGVFLGRAFHIENGAINIGKGDALFADTRHDAIDLMGDLANIFENAAQFAACFIDQINPA